MAEPEKTASSGLKKKATDGVQRALSKTGHVLGMAAGFVAPKWYKNRLLAKNTLALTERRLEAASIGRRLEGFRTTNGDANAETARDRELAIGRASHLALNNPTASRVATNFADFVIGSGIEPRITCENEKVAEHLEQLWRQFDKNADISGQLTFRGQQYQASRGFFERGECLVVFVVGKHQRPDEIPLHTKLLEADHLDETKDRDLSDGGYIQHGIEFDVYGRRRAYHLFDRHPGDSSGSTADLMSSRKVKASEVIHLYDPLRIGQIRGVPKLAPVTLKLYDLDVYQDALIVKQQISSSHAGYIVNPDGQPHSDGPQDNKGRLIESMAPGIVDEVPPGYDIKFNNPPSAGDHDTFVPRILHEISAGVNQPYWLVTGDMAKVNYSAARISLNVFEQHIDSVQERIFIPMLCQRVFDRFLAVVRATSALKIKGIHSRVHVEWITPRFKSIDPVKDATAVLMQIRAGLLPLSNAIRSMGLDPAMVLDEIQRLNTILDEKEIILDSDARRSTRGGNARNDKTKNIGKNKNDERDYSLSESIAAANANFMAQIHQSDLKSNEANDLYSRVNKAFDTLLSLSDHYEQITTTMDVTDASASTIN